MELREFLSTHADELPASARDEIAAINLDHPTSEELFVLVKRVRDAGAIPLADQVLRLVTARIDIKDSLHHALELAKLLIAGGSRRFHFHGR